MFCALLGLLGCAVQYRGVQCSAVPAVLASLDEPGWAGLGWAAWLGWHGHGLGWLVGWAGSVGVWFCLAWLGLFV